MNKSSLFAIFIIILLLPPSSHARDEDSTGILVLAHGTRHRESRADDERIGGNEHAAVLPPWEETVESVVRRAADVLEMPVELAFGMWDRESFQEGVDALAAHGIEVLRVVPLFVSSHSLVIRAQRRLFGLDEGQLPFNPGRIDYPPNIRKVEYTAPLDDHPLLSEILTDRAMALAEDPINEELVLVAHGPVREDDDLLLLKDLAEHAGRIQAAMKAENRPFARIHHLTLRDDAPPAIRDRRTRELRNLVSRITRRGRQALVLPVLLAADGIEAGLIRRLEGLEYRYRGEMIAPHPRLVDWIVESARTGSRTML